MPGSLTADQQTIRDAVLRVCSEFGDDYWLARDRDGEFPEAFKQALVDGGWLGLTMPTEYGGAGLGITEGAVMMQAIAESGAGMSGASAIHLNVFAPKVIVKFGSDEQKQRMLPPIISGEVMASFGVTEPDAGLDTTNIKTKAVLQGDRYIVNGRKVWTTLAQRASKLFLLARTTPREQCKRPTDGITLFYTNLDRSRCEAREIEKMGRKCIDSNQFFIDNLEIPVADRIGEEGRGFEYILMGLNPERILLAAEAIGLGRVALQRATRYANERVVFGRPIGKNQAIQHPLAENWMELEAANLMMLRAAELYDSNQPCGAEANAAKYLAAEAGFKACTQSVMTHGGYGYSKEFHVERYMREVMIPRIAPVSREMILCFIAEKVLGLPKSY
ncbi:acyl-CoA dehydrogenase family protein [Ferrovibrio sp.]|uniref:acyl-CoA dehydrogenase family protein n=1 Tax=Ferrovibrio sp. TaxID=1917215 RepID=UPI000CAB1601|nr:acyl-CoA dehydrogenase family protein [Ferrovibrio sp.]PJI44565.1 MAG: acyl-CoA dehydrogenase [Ferrovibrio sp.]